MFGPWSQSPYSGSPYGASPYGGVGQSPFGPSYNSPYAAPYAAPYSSSYSSVRNPYAAAAPGMPLGAAGSSSSNSVIDRVHSGFSSVGSVTEAMARVTGMLDSNWHSLFMSFASMVRLVEGVHVMRGEFWALLKALSLAKLLHSLYEWFVPPRPLLLADPSANAAEFVTRVASRRRSYLRLFAVLAGLALLVGPWLYSRLRQRQQQQQQQQQRGRRLRRRAADADAAPASPAEADTTPVSRFAECVNDYEAQSSRELSMRRGDIAYVAARVGQHWLAVERRDGARGLVPTTVMRPYDEELRRFTPPGSSARRSMARRRRSNLRPVAYEIDDNDNDDDDDDDDDDFDDGGKKPLKSRAGTTSDRDLARGGNEGNGRRRRFSDEEVDFWGKGAQRR